MISCILFDFDNTLYDYELINKIALNKLFDELVLNNNLNKKYLEKIYKKLNNNIKNSNNSNNKFNKTIYIKKMLELLKISLIYFDKYLKIYEDEFNNNFKLYDGVLELFKYLKLNNIKIGIVSNNIFIQQYKKLKTSYILEYIDFIETSDECGEEKPHINIFLRILII